MMGYQGDIKRKIILFIGFIALIIIALNVLPRLSGTVSKFILPEEYEYVVEVPAKGILARDEKLYYSETDGDIYKVVKEGERVRVGQAVADVLLLEDTTNLKDELSQIENMIDFYSELENDISNSQDASDGLDFLVSNLHQQLSDEDYQGINDTRESIELQSSTIVNASEDIVDQNLSIEDLMDKRQGLLSQIAKYDREIHSNHSGLVSYKIDGWESVLNANLLSDMSIETLKEVQKLGILDETTEKKPVFKIIDDYQWYLIMEIENGFETEFELKEVLSVNILLEEESFVTLELPVVMILEENREVFYVLEGTKFIEKLYDKRFVDINVITFNEETYRIPIESLTEMGDTVGVKVKEFYGVVTFRPVEVVASDEEYAFVSKGDNNGYIKSGDGSVRTINMFSDVITDPDSVDVDEILN
ncbi:HlyD family efflux transporter periplasmic adaptor subunit [Gudongella sp. DL1XJH-153]|uniref:HlyD family efflux transporter periplasmic adaptor subunit n=1 Tax=Gudongella sp. DL1XJH-153 TaxID=3409804 RepID=UPI003BB4AB12